MAGAPVLALRRAERALPPLHGEGPRRLTGGRLQRLPVGTRVFLEGPYGVLTGARRTRPEGAADRRRHRHHAAPRPPGGAARAAGRPDPPLSGARPEDVVFRDELDALARARGATVHYLVGRRGEPGVRPDPLGPPPRRARPRRRRARRLPVRPDLDDGRRRSLAPRASACRRADPRRTLRVLTGGLHAETRGRRAPPDHRRPRPAAHLQDAERPDAARPATGSAAADARRRRRRPAPRRRTPRGAGDRRRDRRGRRRRPPPTPAAGGPARRHGRRAPWSTRAGAPSRSRSPSRAARSPTSTASSCPSATAIRRASASGSSPCCGARPSRAERRDRRRLRRHLHEHGLRALAPGRARRSAGLSRGRPASSRSMGTVVAHRRPRPGLRRRPRPARRGGRGGRRRLAPRRRRALQPVPRRQRGQPPRPRRARARRLPPRRPPRAARLRGPPRATGGAFDVRGHRPTAGLDPSGFVKGWAVDEAARPADGRRRAAVRDQRRRRHLAAGRAGARPGLAGRHPAPGRRRPRGRRPARRATSPSPRPGSTSAARTSATRARARSRTRTRASRSSAPTLALADAYATAAFAIGQTGPAGWRRGREWACLRSTRPGSRRGRTSWTGSLPDARGVTSFRHVSGFRVTTWLAGRIPPPVRRTDDLRTAARPRPRVGPRPDRTRAAPPLRLVLASALLSAALASGGTAALLLATAPAAAPAATAASAPSVVPAGVTVTRLDASDAVAAVAAAVEPSVVTIAATGGGRNATAGGSGIIVSTDGLILTTAVVVPSDATYTILLADQRETTARWSRVTLPTGSSCSAPRRPG